MTITLTGFMASGKTTVGRLLARTLGWEFADLDEYIAHKIGKSVPEIILSKGEEYFRAVEAEAVRDLVMMHFITGENLVLALGGGTLGIAPVRDLLFKRTKCVYLKVSARILKERLSADSEQRPLYSPETVEALLGEREKLYEMAGHTLCADSLSAQMAADEIIKMLL